MTGRHVDKRLDRDKSEVRRPTRRLLQKSKPTSKKLVEGEGLKMKGSTEIIRDMDWCSRYRTYSLDVENRDANKEKESRMMPTEFRLFILK